MARTTLRKTLRSRGHHALIGILVSARKRAGLTQRDLAARLGSGEAAWGMISQCVGALMLARTVANQDVAREILAGARAMLERAADLDEESPLPFIELGFFLFAVEDDAEIAGNGFCHL